MDQVGIAISPGSMVQIAVSPVLINITQNAFERFEPKEKDCYMSKEMELPHFKFVDDYKYEVSTAKIRINGKEAVFVIVRY